MELLQCHVNSMSMYFSARQVDLSMDNMQAALDMPRNEHSTSKLIKP